VEQLQRAGAWLVGAAAAQMLAIGVDQRWPVLRCALQPLGFAGAGVAFDGVERQVEPASAFEQADLLVEQGVDLLPAFAGGLGARAVLRRAGFGPADAVRGDLFQDGLAQVVPQVPSISHLDGVG
jgi:hypothetical protein